VVQRGLTEAVMDTDFKWISFSCIALLVIAIFAWLEEVYREVYMVWRLVLVLLILFIYYYIFI
jgi:hypothetical protein